MLNTKNGFKGWISLLGMVAVTQTIAAPNTSPEAPNTSIKLSAMLQALNNQGYKHINDVEYEDKVIKVEGHSDSGIRFELYLNPKTGDIIKNQQIINPRLSIVDIAKKIETLGYAQIKEIEFDESVYKVEAMDSKGKKHELEIDPNTGAIKTS